MTEIQRLMTEIQKIRKVIAGLEMRHYTADTRSEKIQCTKKITKAEAKYDELSARRKELLG